MKKDRSEGGREGERVGDGGREGEREGRKEGEREGVGDGGREGESEGGKDSKRKREGEGRRKGGGKEGVCTYVHIRMYIQYIHTYVVKYECRTEGGPSSPHHWLLAVVSRRRRSKVETKIVSCKQINKSKQVTRVHTRGH